MNQADLNRLYDCEVIDRQGVKIGSLKQVWLDDRSGRPQWASVHTGFLGLGEAFVPLRGARVGSGMITVPVAKEQVADSPRLDVSDRHMSEEQQGRLAAHYGVPA
ncbi:PRC-barrel domain-containing protein [Actinosynnema sp. NPDC020468]|uniref:PRC-barrel domain-containing protein n=1 Tax=Actinosynnema sp. NPDC020468 TaxID=3154488 RepID=UPI0033DFB64C